MLQGIEERAQPRLVALDDSIFPILRTLPDEPSGVGGEEAVVVAEVEPLGVPLGMI